MEGRSGGCYSRLASGLLPIRAGDWTARPVSEMICLPVMSKLNPIAPPPCLFY